MYNDSFDRLYDCMHELESTVVCTSVSLVEYVYVKARWVILIVLSQNVSMQHVMIVMIKQIDALVA